MSTATAQQHDVVAERDAYRDALEELLAAYTDMLTQRNGSGTRIAEASTNAQRLLASEGKQP